MQDDGVRHGNVTADREPVGSREDNAFWKGDPAAGPHAAAHPGLGQTGDREHSAPRRGRMLTVGIIVLVAAVAAAAYGIVKRQSDEKSLAQWTDGQALPVVATAHPLSGPATRTLALPGDVAAYYEAPIYARVSGYLHMWTEDIGAHVKAGQTLATIDTPDLDQRLVQAQADLATAKSRLALAELTAKRWHALLASNSVSVQSADEKEGNAEAERATVNAQKAHVDQLLALESFKRLAAPFDGVVTARNTDVGALIGAGSNAATPLFKVADMHEMRVYVRVPQSFASELAVGMKARLTEPQFPGQSFPATLATTSQSVAADSRTVLAELLAPNPQGKLWAGTYADVSFDLPGESGLLRVPTSALIFRAQGPQLAIVGQDGRVALKDVTIGRNLGTEIEITGGISATDNVVTAPPDTLVDGEQVDVADAPPAASGHGSAKD
jgi:RND family efflux transporter MFP subunit